MPIKSVWDDFETLAAAASKPKRPTCGVEKLYQDMRGHAKLDYSSAIESIKSAMGNPNLTAGALIHALESKLGAGWNLPSNATVQRHRKGACSCPKGAV